MGLRLLLLQAEEQAEVVKEGLLEGQALPLLLLLPRPLVLVVRLPVRLTLGEGERESLALEEAMPLVARGVRVRVPLPCVVGLRAALKDLLLVGLTEGLREREGAPLAVRAALLGLGERVLERAPLPLLLLLAHLEADLGALKERVPLPLRLVVAEVEGERVREGGTEEVTDTLRLRVPVLQALMERVREKVTLGEPLLELEMLSVAEEEQEEVVLGVCVGV